MILNGNKIAIVSGEGELGTSELYTGKITTRAVKMRLTRERCNGDRWARAIEYAGESRYGGHFGYDLETGAPASWPLDD